jgi:REP element-mobilizing transposase RayT
MARPLRIIYEGAVYHVTLRGNERRAIFRDDRDRERFQTWGRLSNFGAVTD